MRIVSFNANGMRSAARKGFLDWFAAQDADVLCVQETKAQEHQLAVPELVPPGYKAWFRDATTKKGYSGVAIYARREPDEVRTALGWPDFDEEGRYIEARFGNLSVVSFYIPSGTSGDLRQDFKYRVMDWLKPILDQWLASGRDYVLCGDWNIVRAAGDIRNWASNQKNTGCLPRERAWLSGMIADACNDGLVAAPEHGWLDALRVLRPDAVEYTWWSQRGGARDNDVGWRIDYQLLTPSLRDRVRACAVHPEPRFSDHAPLVVDYDTPLPGAPVAAGAAPAKAAGVDKVAKSPAKPTAPAKKATPEKAAAKKVAPRKVASKKVASKKVASKKVAAKKVAAKKSVAKKARGR